MEITLEQVERLREKADVSYARAKQALEYSGGNLLDALIYLEEQGDIPRPEGACYSTRSQTPPPPREEPEEAEPRKRAGKWKKAERGGVLQRLRFLLLDNELEIWRRDSPVTAIPVLILILLLIVAYYIVLPLLILGLFLGFRYRFSGPDLERESINNVMGSVADTAADLGRQVMDELRAQSRGTADKGRAAEKQARREEADLLRQESQLEREAAELERRVEEELLGRKRDGDDPG